MASLIVVGFLLFIVAVAMTMVGKGGGNFYVVILAISGVPMHEAAATGQLMLFSASLAAMIVFQKNKSISWRLAVLVGTFTAVSALGGGYFSHLFGGFSLKLIFAVMLLITGFIMLIPISEYQLFTENKQFGIIRIRSAEEVYCVNLLVVLPVTILTGFGSGMVGVSGGSFLVPLMVLACGLHMHRAVGTAASLIAVTAFMGFAGHTIHGDFNPLSAIPLAIITVLGGILGGKLALSTKPKPLKKLFAYTNWLAALFMIVNALHTKGII